MIVVATDEEYRLARKRFRGKYIIKTGPGALNVIKRLKRIPKWIPVTNFGHVGSNKLPVGTEVVVKECYLYHPNVEYDEPHYHLIDGTVKCYTSNDFVLKTDIDEPVVFDMELAYIMALGFNNVKSIKIVSDNLSLKQYEETVNGKEGN